MEFLIRASKCTHGRQKKPAVLSQLRFRYSKNFFLLSLGLFALESEKKTWRNLLTSVHRKGKESQSCSTSSNGKFKIQLRVQCWFIFCQDLCLLLWKSNLIFFARLQVLKPRILWTHSNYLTWLNNLLSILCKTTTISWFPYFISATACQNQKPYRNLCSRVCCYHSAKWNLCLEMIVNSWIIKLSFGRMLFQIDKNHKRSSAFQFLKHKFRLKLENIQNCCQNSNFLHHS